MSAADDSAVAATNCRRESFLRDMMSPSLLLLSSCRSSFDFLLIGIYADAPILDVVVREDLVAQSEQN
jgi:hypothetical protein